MTSTGYTRAPITEAIIDIRVARSSAIQLEELASIHEEIETDYPERQERRINHGRFEFGEAVTASASSEIVGYLFKSSDGKRIVHASVDGVSLSRLAPYEGWDALSREAQRIWSVYQRIVASESRTRLAVRYINRFDLPLPVGELSDYFRTFPEVSRDLPQALTGFFMQLRIPHADIECESLLTQATVPSVRRDIISVVLDIDLFRSKGVLQVEGAMWNFFETLHQRKNEIFESCLTDVARELIR